MHGMAVRLSNVRGLAADIEGVYRFQLHAGSQLVSLDARLNGRVLLARGLVSAIQRRKERQLTLLIFGCRIVVFDVLNQFLDISMGGVDVCSLEGARQESRPPVLRALNWIAIGAQDDEAGQVLVLRAEGVS